MGNALTGGDASPWALKGPKQPDGDSLTVGMSIDEIEELMRPDVETRIARLKRLSKREKVSEVVKSVTFGTSIGQYAFLLFIAIILLIIGTVAWMSTTGTADYDTSLVQSMWLSYTMFIDIGTQTGVPADESGTIKVTVAVLSFLGFCFNLTFLSVVVDNVRTLLDRLYTRYSQLFVREHVVILGWTSKTLFLVNELISMFADNGGEGDIIIMGNTSRYEMLRSIELTFRRRNPPKPRGVRIRVWEGDSAEEDDLTRLSINTARFVVCLAESEDPRMADAQVLETLLSLLSLDDDDQVTGTVIAELRTADSRRVINELNLHANSDVLGVQSARAVDKILAFNTLRPGVGESLIELISFEGNNFFFEAADDELVGVPFGRVCERFPLCILCGLHSSSAQGALRSEIVIGPPPDRPVQRGDRLLLIAVDRHAIALDRSSTAIVRSCAPGPPVSGAERGAKPAAPLDPALEHVQLRNVKLQSWLRQTVLVIGWRSAREMADLVAVLSQMLLPGSEIHFLSAVDESVREAALRSEMDIFAALTDLAGGMAGGGITVQHHDGSPLASGALELLPLREATAAIVIGDPTGAQTSEEASSYSKGAARLRDARTFHSTTLLRKAAPDLRIVPIYEDILTYRLLRRNDGLVEVDESKRARGTGGVTAVLHRNSLETGLIAMQADDPTLVFVLSQLLALDDVAGQKIFSVPFEAALADMQLTAGESTHGGGRAGGGAPAPTGKLGTSPAEMTFDAMSARVRDFAGHVLIGYFDSALEKVVLNPLKKRVPRRWRATDELILLRAHAAST